MTTFKRRFGSIPQPVLYFYPDDVTGLHASVRGVRGRGYDTSELFVRFYGMKDFEILDPSGHVLVFGQETDEEPTPEA